MRGKDDLTFKEIGGLVLEILACEVGPYFWDTVLQLLVLKHWMQFFLQFHKVLGT